MNFDWKEYFVIARALFDEAELRKTDPTKALLCEALFRSCISRAYYSIFCLARNYLRDVDRNSEILDCDDASIHGMVAAVFRDKGRYDGNCRKIADVLQKMRVARNYADYEDEWQSLSAIAAKAGFVLKDALFVTQLLQKLSK